MGQHETEPIGQLLLDHGWISTAQLRTALERQRELGGQLGSSLLDTDAVPEDLLGKTLAEHTGMPLATLDDLADIPQSALDLLPAREAIRHFAIPFRSGRGRVYLAVAQEPDIPTLDELAFVLGRRIVLHVTNEARIYEALERHYGHQIPTRFSYLLERLNQQRKAPPRPETRVASPPPEKPGPAPSRRLIEATTEAEEEAPSITPPPPLTPRPTSVPLSADEKDSLRQRIQSDQVKPLSQDGVQRALQAAQRADDIGTALVGHLGQEFLRLLVFRVGKGRVKGWMGRSPALDEYAFRNWAVKFDEPSVFLNLRQGAEFFVGRLPAMPAHERLLKCWRGSLETECAVFPIKVRNRLVCAFYGDRDSLGLTGLDVPAIQRLTAKAAIAFEMLLMQRKLRS